MITKTKKIKKSKSNLIFAIVLISGIVLAVGLLVFANWKMGQKRADLLSQIDSLKQEIAELEKKNEDMKKGISQSTQEGYLEKEARERLNLKKPGEEVVVVVPPKEGEQTKEPKNFLERWLEIIKSKF